MVDNILLDTLFFKRLRSGKNFIVASILVMGLILMTLGSNIGGNITTNTQTTVDLGSAGNFAILAKTGVSTTGVTAVTGDIGVSPIAATAVTGFSLTLSPDNKSSTSSLVTGLVYASDYAVPTPSMLIAAVSDMQTAFNNASGRVNPDFNELGTGEIGGMTLTPGLYTWSSAVSASADFTISGSATDVWVFQIAQTFDLSSGVQVLLSGGAVADNIFWVVSGQTTVGTTAVLNGNVLGMTAIVFNTGSTLNGRALSQTAVTLDATTIVRPVLTAPTTTTTSSTTSQVTTTPGATSTAPVTTTPGATSTAPVTTTPGATSTAPVTTTGSSSDSSDSSFNIWFSFLAVITISTLVLRVKHSK